MRRLAPCSWPAAPEAARTAQHRLPRSAHATDRRPPACAQALEVLRKLKSEKVQETKELKLKLEHVRTHKVNADQLKKARLGRGASQPPAPMLACGTCPSGPAACDQHPHTCTAVAARPAKRLSGAG